MGLKSRAGWVNTKCFGYCKFKSDCKPECRKKDLYEDCRVDCRNYGFKCNECDDAAFYYNGAKQRQKTHGREEKSLDEAVPRYRRR